MYPANTIYQKMSNDKRPWYKSPYIMVPIIAAIITAAGGIIAAYIGIIPHLVQEPQPVIVQGIVTDENNMVVGDVTVSIDGQSDMTGNDGRYVIPDVPTGIKTIRVVRRGEEIFKSAITIEGGKKKMTFDIPLTLRLSLIHI